MKTTVKKAAVKKSAKSVKATKKTSKKSTKKTTPKVDNELTTNQQASLKVLAGLGKGSDGLTRIELQEKIGSTMTGYPKLIELGFVTAETYEGSRAKYFKVTAQGKVAAKTL
jgi:hypothetical protein